MSEPEFPEVPEDFDLLTAAAAEVVGCAVRVRDLAVKADLFRAAATLYDKAEMYLVDAAHGDLPEIPGRPTQPPEEAQ